MRHFVSKKNKTRRSVRHYPPQVPCWLVAVKEAIRSVHGVFGLAAGQTALQQGRGPVHGADDEARPLPLPLIRAISPASISNLPLSPFRRRRRRRTGDRLRR